MKKLHKLVLCLGLLGILSAPLAGCSGTWHGMKDDWHDMTSSNDSEETTTTASTAPQPEAQPQQQAQAETTTTVTSSETTTFNR